MKKVTVVIAVLIVIAVVVIGYFLIGRKPETTYKTAKAERGNLIESVSATGNLAAVVTVQVGTQASGTIQQLFVDFNSPVKKGQVIAQIDPSLFNAQVEQTRGNYLNAQATLQKAKADMQDAKRNLERNRQLVKEGIVAQSDFDTAENRYEMAVAAAKGAEGSVAQTRGSLAQAETNLRNATIRSPVDGIVVSRAIDVGQTVAASFQTPTLFTIAQDLTKMQIDTSVDEADIARVQVGQTVSFTVDAYPEVQFEGAVRQVRNAPVIAQNVVTYVVVIDVNNKDMRLKPGMTANVNIVTASRDNVLKIPSAALRFKPKDTGKARPAGIGRSTGESREKGGPAAGKSVGNKVSGQKIFLLDQERKPVPVPVVTGISGDGQVEVVDGTLKEGDEVILDQISPQKKKSAGGMGGPPMGPRF